jgi:hypothetical protein
VDGGIGGNGQVIIEWWLNNIFDFAFPDMY